MKITEQVAKQFNLPQESLGGFYSVRFEKKGGTLEEYYDIKLGRVTHRLRDAIPTGNSQCRLTMLDGLVFIAKAKKNKIDSFNKKLAHKLLSGRVAKHLEQYWQHMFVFEFLEREKASRSDWQETFEIENIIAGFCDCIADIKEGWACCEAEIEYKKKYEKDCIQELAAYLQGMEYAKLYLEQYKHV